MPVLDYVNHKVTTNGFQINEEKKSVYLQTREDQNFKELFVCYNYYDALETLIYYGFCDTSSPVLFSIPMQIPLSNGVTLQINNIGFRKLSQNDVSKILLPIKDLIPKIEKKDDKLTISKLTIPNKHLPLALRHILHLVLHELKIDFSDTVRLPIIQDIEKFIIKTNIIYYQQLEEMLPMIQKDKQISFYVKNQLKNLIKNNLKHLKEYGSWF